MTLPAWLRRRRHSWWGQGRSQSPESRSSPTVRRGQQSRARRLVDDRRNQRELFLALEPEPLADGLPLVGEVRDRIALKDPEERPERLAQSRVQIAGIAQRA